MNTLNIADNLFISWTEETAPFASLSVLERAEKALGFVPNLMETLAGSPAA